MASSGIPELDALTGGLPRGCLTEICGPASSGRTTLLLAALVGAVSIAIHGKRRLETQVEEALRHDIDQEATA